MHTGGLGEDSLPVLRRRVSCCWQCSSIYAVADFKNDRALQSGAGALKHPHTVLGMLAIFMYVGGESNGRQPITSPPERLHATSLAFMGLMIRTSWALAFERHEQEL